MIRWLLLLLFLGLLGGCSSSEREVINVDLSGTVRYEDKLYNIDGFTGARVLKPVRHTKVELVGGDGVVAATFTDNDGAYALAGRGSGLYIRVVAQSDGALSHPVEVVPTSLPSQLIAVRGPSLGKASTDVDIDITLAKAGAVAGAFNILDVYQNAGEFIAAHGAVALPTLQVRWEECSVNGTYSLRTSDPNLVIIALLGLHSECAILQRYSGQADTDEYDDDVMWHEYGHFLEFAFDTIDSPGSAHTLTDLAQDMRLAWSEGWSSYLSGAIKAWLGNTYPERLSIDTLAGDTTTSLYIDTFSSSAFSYDFRSGTLEGTALTYATNEGAIAKMLWGVDDDAVFDFSSIWQILTTHLPVDNGRPSNLEKFWDGWIASGLSPTSTLRAILNERQVVYENDASESDDTLVEAQALRATPDFYTLFTADGAIADVDLVPFAVTSGSRYRVETYNLHNGADTYLRILDTNGDVVSVGGSTLTNDNHTTVNTPPDSPNDTCLFSSRLEFDAQESTTYYSEVSSSPDRVDGSGRLGDYQLNITENPAADKPYECP